jgi:uncharacterized protein YggU (UPF0235/DUF167 family)
VAAPAEGGRANEAVLRLLADTLGVDVRLVSGHSSRDKVVALELETAKAEGMLAAASGKVRG